MTTRAAKSKQASALLTKHSYSVLKKEEKQDKQNNRR